MKSFNSCPREGAIALGHCISGKNLLVSTHAPARGQSLNILPSFSRLKFQLMPPRGGNHKAL